MKNLIVCLCLLYTSTNLHAQYIETFSLDKKGILSGPCGLTFNTCDSIDFTEVDWTIVGDDLTNIEAGDFVFSDGSSLMFSNVDVETCWESPELDITSISNFFSFSLDLSWIGFDQADYIKVEYNIDYSGWTQMPNVVGGGLNTIQFLTSNNYGDTSLTQDSLSGNSTFKLRVCVDANIASEIVTLDNVFIPEVGGSLVDSSIFSNFGTDVQIACDSFIWIDGNTYTSSNDSAASFTLTNVAGADSVVSLDLTINYSSIGTDTQIACNSFVWIDGNTYTSSIDSAFFTLTNSVGCDSIVTLNLTINNSNTGTDTQIACDSYTWIDGNTYVNSNDSSIFILTNVEGCDSIVTLDLTVLQSSIDSLSLTEQDSLNWNGSIITESLDTTITFPGANIHGCDSTIVVSIIIEQSTNIEYNSFISNIYPNPTNGIFNIILDDKKDIFIQIYNPLGQLVKEESHRDKRKYESTLGEMSGLYLVKIRMDNQEYYYKIFKY